MVSVLWPTSNDVRVAAGIATFWVGERHRHDPNAAAVGLDVRTWVEVVVPAYKVGGVVMISAILFLSPCSNGLANDVGGKILRDLPRSKSG